VHSKDSFTYLLTYLLSELPYAYTDYQTRKQLCSRNGGFISPTYDLKGADCRRITATQQSYNIHDHDHLLPVMCRPLANTNKSSDEETCSAQSVKSADYSGLNWTYWTGKKPAGSAGKIFLGQTKPTVNGPGPPIFTAQCTLVQSAVLGSHMSSVRLSVCLSVCNVGDFVIT